MWGVTANWATSFSRVPVLTRHSQVAQRFRSICDTLHNHQNAFAIFPPQNNYASALCGSQKFIISAAANRIEITEIISDAVPYTNLR
jgi:hypothetical protein